VDVEPVFEVNCNSVPDPKADRPGFTNAKEPGFVPTLTLELPDEGVGKKVLTDAVELVNVPVPVPKL
jgi:hypothetical protein